MSTTSQSIFGERVAQVGRACRALLVCSFSSLFTVGAMLVAGGVMTSAYAQDYTSGVLNGRVVDEGGKAVADAKISVTSEQGLSRSATSDASGSFRVPALPVGTYAVVIEKTGLGSQTSRATVEPGSSSYEFVLSSKLSEVVVSAQAIRDTSITDSGLTVDVQELANQIPVGRSINAITLLTPMAISPDPSIAGSSRRNQGLSSISGTSAAESVYYINGLNVTDQRNFLGYADLPFMFLKTVDTKTGGYSAEFGRGTGAVVNMVTRSGTNDWKFGANVTYTPDSLRADRGLAYSPGGSNSPGTLIFNQTSESDSATYTVYAGGPVIADRLFVFGIYEGRKVEGWGSTSFPNFTTTTGSQTYFEYDDPFVGGKLDFVITDDHLLEATIWSDKTETRFQPWVAKRANADRFNPGAFTRTEKSPAFNTFSGGTNYIVKYSGVFSESFTLSALYGRVNASYLDQGEAVNFPGVLDFGFTGYANNRRFGLFNLRGKDERDTYRVDADFYFDWQGAHQLRVGFDREDLVTDAYSAYNGGAVYYAYSGADCGTTAAACVEKLTFANQGVFEAEQTAAYIQDSWQLTDNLNVNLGVRWDSYDYLNSGGESYVKIDDQFAPRLGIVWDPSGAGRDRVYGFVGDYYLPIATNTSLRASSGEIYTDEYFAGSRNPDGSLVLNSNGYPVLGAKLFPTDYYSPPGVPDPRAVATSGLKPMYEREFSLGYERTLDIGWNAGIRLVYRSLKSTIEDTAIGDAIVRWCVRTGTPCGQSGPGDRDFSSLFPYVLLNPGSSARVWLDPDGDARANLDGSRNPGYSPRWIELTTADLALPEADRSYKALELTFERPFDGTWSLRGSYVYSKSEGNYEGAVKSDIGQTDTSITQDFDHAANQIGSNGLLPNDRRHVLKLFGNYALMNGKFNVGVTAIAASGRPYGCIGYTPLSVDGLAPQSGTPSGWHCPSGPYTGNGSTVGTASPVTLVGRGSRGQTAWDSRIDLSLAWNVLQSDAGNLRAQVDVFNLFDFDKVIRVVEQGEIRRGETASKGFASPAYGLPRTFQGARSVRFMVSYDF